MTKENFTFAGLHLEDLAVVDQEVADEFFAAVEDRMGENVPARRVSKALRRAMMIEVEAPAILLNSMRASRGAVRAIDRYLGKIDADELPENWARDPNLTVRWRVNVMPHAHFMYLASAATGDTKAASTSKVREAISMLRYRLCERFTYENWKAIIRAR